MSKHGARTLVIGDVHGCLQELQLLLRTSGCSPQDRLIFVGDLVAKGPDSAGVVALAREASATCVRGNHEAHWLRVRPAASAALVEEDWRWLEALPLYHCMEDHTVVVHAALAPGVPLADQRPEDLLTGRSLTAEGSISARLADGVPWASAWPGPQHVVFGHDAVRGLQRHPYATGIDTGCVYGGRLTALELPSRRLWSVAALRCWASPTQPARC